jgi:Uma2 family endonuclease
MAPQDTLATRPLTKADFFDFMSKEPEGRYEFEDGRIVDMTGGTRNHSAVGSKFLIEIGKQIDDTLWTVHGHDRGVELPDSVRYPDVIVDRTTEDGASRWTTEPILIVEVLSPSSRRRDLVRKAAEYVGIPTLRGYIVAEPDEPRCYVWVRDAMGQFPEHGDEIHGKGGVVIVSALGVTIKLGDVYRQVLRATPAP